MSILDDAIREHLELKRAHGADEGELQRLEDEAFGPPQRPDEFDPFAEAPTEFLLSPSETAAELPEIGDEAARGGRRPDVADLQEAPPPAPEDAADALFAPEAPFAAEDAADTPFAPEDAADTPPPPFAPEDADLPLFPEDDADAGRAAPPPAANELASPLDAPPPSPADAAAMPPPPPPGEMPVDLAPPFVEEHPAAEHEIVPDAGPGTEERQAIADQPTQMFDVQAEMDAEAPPAPAEQPSPTDEQLVDAAQNEPQAAPPAPEQPPLEPRGPDAEVAGHPPAEAAPEEESAEFDFFNEQRLSDELDQALEAPIADDHGLPDYADAPPAQRGIFDFESEGEGDGDGDGEEDEEPSEEAPRPAPEPPSEEAPHAPTEEPPSEEAPHAPTHEPPSEEAPRGPVPEPPSEEAPRDSAEPPSEEGEYAFDPDTGHEDVLEDTPRFLEDAPEDDDLWFEQKPPKDFDLD